MRCAICGAKIPEGGNACIVCLTPVAEMPQPEPAPQPAPQPAPAPEPIPQPAPAPQPEPVPQPAPAPQPAPTERMGVLRGIAGAIEGSGYRLPEENKMIVGSSSEKAFWVIDDPLISRYHLSIRYQAIADLYMVTDYSENGTYIDGNRLEKGMPTPVKAGTILSLANGENQILLG